MGHGLKQFTAEVVQLFKSQQCEDYRKFSAPTLNLMPPIQNLRQNGAPIFKLSKNLVS